MRKMQPRTREFLAWVASTAAEVTVEYGMASDHADQIGAAMADRLAENWGGQTLYFPNDASYKITPRDRAILVAHREGASVAKLAREYKMSEQGMRKLLRRAASRDKSLNQLKLFDAGS